MLLLVLMVAAPAVARVDQAADRVVNQAQVAVEQGEGDAVYQAISQAQSTKQGVEQSSAQNDDSITSTDIGYLLAAGALFVAGGALAYIFTRRQRKRRQQLISRS